MIEIEEAIEVLRQEVQKLKVKRGEMEAAQDAYDEQKRLAREAETAVERLIRQAVGTEYTSPADAPRL